MCRQCVIKLGIVSSSECHWYWHTLYGPHYMRVCISLTRKPKYFLNYGDINVQVRGYWLSATRVNYLI